MDSLQNLVERLEAADAGGLRVSSDVRV